MTGKNAVFVCKRPIPEGIKSIIKLFADSR